MDVEWRFRISRANDLNLHELKYIRIIEIKLKRELPWHIEIINRAENARARSLDDHLDRDRSRERR